jgi:heterodisulfide reductase subunit A-like polyferredoxin
MDRKTGDVVLFFFVGLVRLALLESPRGGDMTAAVPTVETILVVGRGVSGMTAALEAAECG